MINRQFNHDIRLGTQEQGEAKSQWPAIAHILVNPALIERFTPHEKAAKRYKLAVQWLGTVAVLMVLIALAGAAFELWASASDKTAVPGWLESVIEVCGLIGVVFAFLASRYGPFRRRWLKNRFLTECYRQWHFARLLDGPAVEAASESDAAQQTYLQERTQRFDQLVSRIAGFRGAADGSTKRMRRAFYRRCSTLPSLPPQDPYANRFSTPTACLDWITSSTTRSTKLARQQDVRRVLTEVDCCSYGYVGWHDPHLAPCFFDGAVGSHPGHGCPSAQCCSASQVWPSERGVTVSRLEKRKALPGNATPTKHAQGRWRKAHDDDERLKIATEVEQYAVKLRSFVRIHETAKFLF